MLKKDRAKH